MSDLSVLKKEELADNYFLFSDFDSVKDPIERIVNFLTTSYRTYKTGYNIFDDSSIIDSSSLTIIAGPTNHSKSIFMMNIIKNMIEGNYDDFDENDVFVFVSLEDDQNKIFRRLLSIFGNYDSGLIKSLFAKLSELLQSNQVVQGIANQSIKEKVSTLLEEVANDALIGVTKGKIKFLTKYVSENSFSSSDACRMLDSLLFQGLKPRALFIDYIDVMIPSQNGANKGSSINEYVDQGKIIHELRKASRKYSLPIITITQNTRFSENANNELDNSHLADSFKKARYSDSIIMIRQRQELDILHETVSPDLMIDENMNFSNIPSEFLYTLIPFEVKITKAKDGPKNFKKFHIFCFKNLRIYQSINDLVTDLEDCKVKSKALFSKLNIIGLNDEEAEINLEDNIDNLFV